MRAAVLASLSVVLVGIYLAIAAVLALSPAAIGIGVLVVSLVMATVIAMSSGRTATRPAAARG